VTEQDKNCDTAARAWNGLCDFKTNVNRMAGGIDYRLSLLESWQKTAQQEIDLLKENHVLMREMLSEQRRMNELMQEYVRTAGAAAAMLDKLRDTLPRRMPDDV